MDTTAVNKDILQSLDWYGFGFRDGRVYGHTEKDWNELANELTQYEPLFIRADGLVTGMNGSRPVALIKGTKEDAKRILETRNGNN